jgi:hypothetical protein
MQHVEPREMEWAPPKDTPSSLEAVEDAQEEYGPWQWAAALGAATGRLGAEAFVLQENGTLRCPAGSSLWLSEIRQENAFTQRAVYLGFRTDWELCALKEQCLGLLAQGTRARRVSAVRRLLPPLPRFRESLSHSDRYDGWMWQVERFAASGLPIGEINTPRSFCLSNTLRGVSLRLVPLVRCVRMTAGVGPTDSHQMLGGDHRNCV